MQILGGVRQPRPRDPELGLGARARLRALGAAARCANERSSVRSCEKHLRVAEGDLSYVYRRKGGNGIEFSQFNGSKSCWSGAEETNGSTGRKEVHEPLRTFISEVYADNSTLGKFLRAWRSQPAELREKLQSGERHCSPRLVSMRASNFRKRGNGAALQKCSRAAEGSGVKLAQEMTTLQVGIATWIACGSS